MSDVLLFHQIFHSASRMVTHGLSKIPATIMTILSDNKKNTQVFKI